MEHHSDIIGFDVEAATAYHPGSWKLVAQGILKDVERQYKSEYKSLCPDNDDVFVINISM